MSDPDRLIKKYPNRRLYDTRTSAYITLADVKGFVLSGEGFKVVDARSGVDLTRSILLQIIVEEEEVGVPLFTEKLLGQMLCFYGHSMQATLGKYLEVSMDSFSDFQNRLQEQSHLIYGDEGCRMQGEMWAQFFGFSCSGDANDDGYLHGAEQENG